MVNDFESKFDNESIDDVVHKTYVLGLKWMKCENYQKASELFAKAIAVSRSYPLEKLEALRAASGLPKRCSHDESKAYHPIYSRLLDGRIVCLMKVQKFDRALKESKYYCKVEPTSTKALIRLGKSYELTGSLHKALEIYLKAKQLFFDLKKNGYQISLSHEEMVRRKCIELSFQANSNDTYSSSNKRLKRTLSMTMENMEPETTRSRKTQHARTNDPVTVFPPEIVAVIFFYLEPRDVLNCLVVNKMWNYKLTRTPMLINNIGLSKTTYSKIKSLLFFNSAKCCINKNLETFSVSFRSPFDEDKCLKNICLELNLRARKIVVQTKNLELMKVFRYLKSSNTFLPSVEEVSVLAPYSVGTISEYDERIISACTQLKKLEILITPGKGVNTEPSIPPFESSNILPQKIETVKIIFQGCNEFKNFPLGVFFQLRSNPLMSVKKLVLVNSNINSLKNIKWIENFPNLQYLWFERNKQFCLMDFILRLKYKQVFKELKFLTFRENPLERIRSPEQHVLTAEELLNVTLNLRNLESFDIMNSSISTTVLHQILSDSSYIRSLNLGNISGIYTTLNDQTSLETDFLDFLPELENLVELYLPNIKYTINPFRKLSLILPRLKHLKFLDLSFNPSMQGFQLYEILSELTKEGVVLDFLCVDSCVQLSPMSIKEIENTGMVKTVSGSFNRTQWEKFSKNSFWIH